MLTDWEQRQIAEIEQALADDFTLRRRARRRIGSIGWRGAMSALAFLVCLAALLAVRVWWVAAAFAAIYALTLMLGARVRHRARRQSRLRA